MNIERLVKLKTASFRDRQMISHKKKIEIKKFEDDRRRRIWGSIELTDDQKKRSISCFWITTVRRCLIHGTGITPHSPAALTAVISRNCCIYPNSSIL